MKGKCKKLSFHQQSLLFSPFFHFYCVSFCRIIWCEKSSLIKIIFIYLMKYHCSCVELKFFGFKGNILMEICIDYARAGHTPRLYTYPYIFTWKFFLKNNLSFIKCFDIFPKLQFVVK